jgi:long-chain acyl-CoA synthetase
MNAGSLLQAGPQTLPQWLLHRTDVRPTEIGQRHKRDGIWREFSWAAIRDEVQALALGLAARGVRRGQTVLLIGENRPEMYWAEWAAMSLGAKAVALYPDAAEAELDFVSGDAQAVCIFAEDQEQVDKALPVAARHQGIHTVVWWEPGGLWGYRDAVLFEWNALKALGEAPGRDAAAWFEQEVLAGRSNEIALLSYTSGTTGRPKGVITTHASLMHNAQLLADVLQVPEHCEYLSYVPLSWGTEQWVGVTLGLMRPIRVNFAEAPDQIQQAIRELACQMVFFGPRQWESLAALVHARMLDAPAWRRKLVDWGLRVGQATRVARIEGRAVPAWARALLPLAETLVLRPLREQLGLKHAGIALIGGAAMAPEIFRLFAAMGVMLRSIYGCSEIGLIASHQGDRIDAETIGAPIKHHSVWGGPLDWRLSEEGELQVRGGTGFEGYWGLPEKSAEKFDGDWFRTGDAVGVAADGRQLVYYDRVEHMSQLSVGARFSKQFIEVRLRFSPYIREVMVIGDAHHPFVAALVNIDGEVFGRWAEHHGVGYTTFADLSQHPAVLRQVAAEIEKINRHLPEHARVRRFANLPKELDADEGELTRTRKLKREFIEERYGKLIEALYGDGDMVALEVPVRYQDGRSGVLRADVRLDGSALAGSRDAAAPQGVTT